MEHPVITNLERTGYPDGKEPVYPTCPVCGEKCETIYADRMGDVFACDVCVIQTDSWEVEDCFPEKEVLS